MSLGADDLDISTLDADVEAVLCRRPHSLIHTKVSIHTIV
jgi:hypothetical protein